MTAEGERAIEVVRTAIVSSHPVLVALQEAAFTVIAAAPSQAGQKFITFWTPSEQLITLRLGISAVEPHVMIEEIEAQ